MIDEDVGDASDKWKTTTTKKRSRDSPLKDENLTKQKTLHSYWLADKKNSNSSNRFDALQNDEISKEVPNSTEKVQKPPPIFVDHVSNIQPLIDMLNEKVNNEYVLRVIKPNQIKIQPSKPDIYSIIVKELTAKNTEFFTYKAKNERSFRTILRNMHHSVDVEEVKAELLSLGHKVTNIYNMKHRESKLPLPMFVVEFEQQTNNKEIYEIKGLLHLRIDFEPPRPKRQIPQCANCQRYGHTKSFCHRKPKCIKCAGDHLSKNCSRQTRSDSVKCALCEGNHPANYKGCRVYQDLQRNKYPPLRTREIPKNSSNANDNLLHKSSNHVSYADIAKNSNPTPKPPSNSEQNETAGILSELRETMSLIRQMMQQMTAMTNLLVNLMSKQSASPH